MEEIDLYMKNKFVRLLDVQLDDSIMEKLNESGIDLSISIDLDDQTYSNEFGITLGRNNKKNDLSKINNIVKQVQNGAGLDNSIIEKLLEDNINYDHFLNFEQRDFTNYGFKLGTTLKIKQKCQNILLTREEDNKKIEVQLNFKKLKKLLCSESCRNDQFDQEFNRIILEDLSQESLREFLKNKRTLLSNLKPYLIDNLKRIKRFKSIKDKLKEIAYEKTNNDIETKKLLELITEKDLVICLMEIIGIKSLPRLGRLLSKNDYPLPLFYQIYNHERGDLEEKVNFEILTDLLCLTNTSLAIVSGTSLTIRQGKSMLIPFMFPGLNLNSVYEMHSKTPFQNSVDIIFNEELNESWVIADFNGELKGLNMTNLFKSISAFATMHVLNANVSDFDEKTGKPLNEVINILNNYDHFKVFSSSGCSLNLIVLIHYNFENNFNLFEKIKKNLSSYYPNTFVLTVDNLFDSGVDSEILKINKNNFKKDFQAVFSSLEHRKFQSIFDVKSFYEILAKYGQYSTVARHESWVEKEFMQLFGSKGNKIEFEAISKMFELSNIYKNIEINENKLIDSNSQHKNLNKNDINKTIYDLKQHKINPMNKILSFFIRILESDQDFLINLSVFEKCLINYKKEELKNLREHRKDISNKLSKMDIQIKLKQTVDNKDHENLMEKLQQLDEKIKIIDLTVDKFWDELFLYVDWLDETKNSDHKLKDKIVDRFIKLIQNGHSIHLLRGSPLRVKSNLLRNIMNRMDNFKNIYVLSVIGEQSSAKSSLLNSLFGCDFRTSAGRCTVGIYMNFVRCGDKTIVILDTEGLASIESSNKLFDNQMATMSVFSSHQMLINHKGEISSNLENILGITYFAKVNLTNLSYKPAIFFVLRDQLDRSESSINIQVSKLKERLIKQSEFIKTSLDDVFDIDTNHLTLLSSAFSELDCPSLDKSIKCRNSIFPDQALELRKKLIKNMDEIDKEFVIENLSALYTRLDSHWNTISSTGKNIFNCKDLEELKIRNEISAISHEIFEKYRTNLNKEIDEKINKIIDDFKQNQKFDSNSEKKCSQDIIRLISDTKGNVDQQFDSQTNMSFYSKAIKDEYKNLLSYQFKWIEDLSIRRLNENCICLKNMHEFSNANENTIRQINDLLSTNVNQNEAALIDEVTKRLNGIEKENNEKLKLVEKSIENIIDEIERLFYHNVYLIRFKNNKLNGIENKLNLIDYYNSKLNDNSINLEDYGQDWSKFIEKIKYEVKNISSSKQKIKQFVEEWCENLIIDFDNRFLNNSSVFHVTEGFISDILVFLNSSLSHPDSIVNKYNLNFGKLFNALIKHFLFLIVKKSDEIQKSNLEKEKEKYKNQKKELIEKTKITFKLKNDSKKLGLSIAEDFISKIFENLIQTETLSITNSCKEKINEKFKTPNELIEHAFKMSFETCNYDQVFKYVIDVNRYCKEVCFENIKDDLKILILKEQIKIKNLYTQFFEFLKNFHLSNEISSCCQFFQYLMDEAKKVNESLAYLFKAKNSIIGTEIKYKDLFVSGFKESIGEFYKQIEIKLNIFDEDLDKKCKSQIIDYIDVYLGCSARCPCCGSKCENAKGHEGHHCSNFHLIDGFFRWGEKDTNKVSTYFCWEEIKFNKVYILLGDKKFENCKEFLEKEHPDWLNDIQNNYKNYGKNPSNSGNIKFRNQIIRAWMNTRKPLLKIYKRLDKDYDDEWISMEDNKQMLQENHTPKWNYDF
ncbi:interferon-induced very large GTPase 1-like [Brachionus plicatilis]|uniref:Interferon-induced very large GTPase 1-like n=1 Tax=Brachionus plicatilis TaxID=10195 RepID=A0A3M7Q1Q7_BRAPC|nr:interferon-induced very large GTPase 1-like [Brachionus plicatilis]